MKVRYADNFAHKFVKMEKHREMKTIVLDLDETLIRSKVLPKNIAALKGENVHLITVNSYTGAGDSVNQEVYVMIRPGC